MVFRSPCRLSPAVLPAPLMDLQPPIPSAAQSLPGEASPCPPPARCGCHCSLLNTNRLSGGFIVAPGNWGQRAGSFRGMCLSRQRPIGTRAFANFCFTFKQPETLPGCSRVFHLNPRESCPLRSRAWHWLSGLAVAALRFSMAWHLGQGLEFPLSGKPLLLFC